MQWSLSRQHVELFAIRDSPKPAKCVMRAVLKKYYFIGCWYTGVQPLLKEKLVVGKDFLPRFRSEEGLSRPFYLRIDMFQNKHVICPCHVHKQIVVSQRQLANSLNTAALAMLLFCSGFTVTGTTGCLQGANMWSLYPQVGFHLQKLTWFMISIGMYGTK